MIVELTIKLKNGWNPWLNDDIEIRVPDLLLEAISRWELVKTKQLRHSSPYAYASFANILRQWILREGLQALSVHEFGKTHARAFMAYVTDERKVSNRTYNNYRVHFAMMFKWFCSRNLRRENPFEDFMKLKESGKTRIYLTEEDRQQMTSWIMFNDPNFWLPCLFIYGSLIRPGELLTRQISIESLARSMDRVEA